jgi:hypothetical protein
MPKGAWHKVIERPDPAHDIEIAVYYEGNNFLRNVRTMRISTIGLDGRERRITTWLINDNQSPPQLVFKHRWPGVRKCFCGAVLGCEHAGIMDHWEREHKHNA